MLQQYVANDVDFVFTGNLERVLEVTESKLNSDGTVELTGYMQKLVASLPVDARNGVNDALDAKGFGWNAAVCAVRITSQGYQSLNIWTVKDEGDYADYFVKRYGYTKSQSDGYTVLRSDDVTIVLNDGLAFFVLQNHQILSGNDAVKAIKDWRSLAKSKHMASWKSKYLDNGDVVSVLFCLDNVAKLAQNRIDNADFYEQTRPDVLMLSKFLPDARRVTIGATFNIDGLKATIKGKLFSSNGDAYRTARLDGTFNASLLKYVTPKDMAVVGVANASFITTMLGHSVTGLGSDIITKWLDNFAGSMMVATGLKGNDFDKLVKTPTSELHWVMAAECKPGKAAQALNAFATLVPFADGASVSKHEAGKELRFRVATSYNENDNLEPWEDGYYTPVYTNIIMRTDGDVLLISNEEIDATPVADFTADMFKNKSVVGVVHAAKDNTLMKTINAPFGAELRGALDSSEFEVELELNNTDKNLIEALVGFAGPALNR
jgi:hypothetical protein